MNIRALDRYDQKSPETLALVIQRWPAIYRIRVNGAQVARIVDGARDLSRLVLRPE